MGIGDYVDFKHFDLMGTMNQLYIEGLLHRPKIGRYVYEADPFDRKVTRVEVTRWNIKDITLARGIFYMDTEREADEFVSTVFKPPYDHNYRKEIAKKYDNPFFEIIDYYNENYAFYAGKEVHA